MWWWRGKGISQTGFSFLLLVAPLEREMFMRQIIPFLSPAFYSLSGKHNFSSIDIPNSIVEAHWKGNRARAHSSNNNRSEVKKKTLYFCTHTTERENGLTCSWFRLRVAVVVVVVVKASQSFCHTPCSSDAARNARGWCQIEASRSHQSFVLCVACKSYCRSGQIHDKLPKILRGMLIDMVLHGHGYFFLFISYSAIFSAPSARINKCLWYVGCSNVGIWLVRRGHAKIALQYHVLQWSGHI